MADSKLEYFLNQMSDSETEAFRTRLVSSRRKKEQILGQLLDLILENKYDNAGLYQVLYPQKAYSDKQIRNLRSELFRRLTDFLAVRLFETSPEKTLFVARTMNRLQVSRHFPAVLDKYLKQHATQSSSLEQMDLQNRIQAEILQYQSSVAGRRGFPLVDLMVNHEEAFVARMLYYALAYQTGKQMYQGMESPPSLQLWQTVIGQLENGAWAESNLIQVYFGLYQMITHPHDEVYFHEVKSRLTSFGEEFGKQEAKHMYTTALNYGIQRINQGKKSFLPEIYHLYLEMLDRNILVGQDGLEAWHFKAIVTCAVQLGHFEWAGKFMESYYLFLPPDFRENLLNYCQGLLAFFQGDYGESEAKMNLVLQQYTDPFFGLDTRGYLLRIYYETENHTGMEALVNSFRLFLRRHKDLTPSRLKNYQEFIRFFRRMVALPPDKPQRALKLKNEILASPHNAGRDWFLAKLDQLIQ